MNNTEIQTPTTGSSYTRGTATAKITSARVAPGTLLLTEAEAVSASTFDVRGIATVKGGSVWREVATSGKSAPGQAYGNRGQYVITFTDGYRSPWCAPSQTWMTPATTPGAKA